VITFLSLLFSSSKVIFSTKIPLIVF